MAAFAGDIKDIVNPETAHNQNWYYELAQALGWCSSREIGTIILPRTLDAFFPTWSGRDTADLQHLLTQHVDHKLYTKIFGAGDASFKNRLRSQSTGKNTSWAAILPTTDNLRFNDVEFRDIARMHLGIAIPELGSQCACKDDPFNDAVTHFMTCPVLRRREVTDRHDYIKFVLADLARNAGMHVKVEPLTYENSAKRPDIMISMEAKSYYLDVSVAHPLALSTLLHGSEKTGYTAAKREKKKITKYRESIQQEGGLFYPLVVESYGMMADESVKALHLLTSHAQKPTPWFSWGSTMKFWKQNIIASLQKGNSKIIRAAAVLNM